MVGKIANLGVAHNYRDPLAPTYINEDIFSGSLIVDLHTSLQKAPPHSTNNDYSTEKWKDLPLYPYHDSGLVITDSELTTVGGWCGRYHHTEEMVEKYPPMNTANYSPALVSTSDGDNLIVMVEGGLW